MLTQPIDWQATGLVAQDAIDHCGEGFAAQHLACLGHQLSIHWIGAEALLQQPRQMGVQTVLGEGVTGIALRPVGGGQSRRVRASRAFGQLQHQVSSQVTDQPLPIAKAAADALFQLRLEPRQQIAAEGLVIGCLGDRANGLSLIESGAFAQRRSLCGWKDLGAGIGAVQYRQHGAGIGIDLELAAGLYFVLHQLSQTLQPLVIVREAAGPERRTQGQAGQGCGIEATLPPAQPAQFALVETGQGCLGKDHATEQLADEAWLAAAVLG